MKATDDLDSLIFGAAPDVDEYALLAAFVVCRDMYQGKELTLRKAAELADGSDIATVAKVARYIKDKEALITCLLRAPVDMAETIVGYLVEIASDDKAAKDRLLHLILSLSSANDLSFAALSSQRYLRPVIKALIRMDKSYAAKLLKMAFDGELNKYTRCLVLDQFKGEKVLSCALDMIKSEQDGPAATLLFDIILRNMENASKYEQQLLREAYRFMTSDNEYTRMQATMVALCFDSCNEFVFSSVIKGPQTAASALMWAVAWRLPIGKDNLKSVIDIIVRNENDPSVRRALPFARMLNSDIKGSAFCGDHTVTECIMLEILDDAINDDRRVPDECVSCS